MVRHRIVCSVLLSSLLLLCLAVSATAQSIQSSVLGHVADATGAAVPGARVVLLNEGTGIMQAMEADAGGDYRFSGLLPGMYRVTVTAPGFKAFAAEHVDLVASQSKRIDPRLEVGDVTANVTVEGSVSQLETEAATLSNLKTSRDFTQLPLSIYGRGWSNVTTLVAGIQFKNGMEVNGARRVANNFTSDGIAVNDTVNSMYTPNGFSGEVEVLEEVKVQTADNSAEFPQVAQFNAVTKAGTNDLHGSVYWGNFNSIFSARQWQDRTSPSFTNHNMFAITNGGPVEIPHLYNGKNRTFYFFSYGGDRYRIGNRQMLTVPTDAFRQGDFSAIASQITVKDPLTGQPFPGNRLPASRISPVSQTVQNMIYPEPNEAGAGALGIINNRYSDPGGRFDSDVYSFRVDHKLSDTNTVFTRVGYTRNNKDSYPGPLLDNYGAGSYRGNIPGRSVVISDTSVLNPRTVNEAKLGFSRTFAYDYDYNYGSDVLSKLGIQGIDNPANDPAIGGMPVFGFGGAMQFAGTSAVANANSQAQNTYEGIDNFSWFHGRHTIKAGVDFRRYQVNDQVKPQAMRGAYTFNDLFSGFNYANFLLGLPASARRTIPRPNAYIRSSEVGLYLQDTFKISSRITLNYGMRYEYQTPWTENNNRMFTFLPSMNEIATAGNSLPGDMVPAVVQSLPPIVTAASAGLPVRSMFDTDINNWSPRVGLAIRPFNNTTSVLRLGYGIYSSMWPGLLALNSTGGPWQSEQDFSTDGVHPTIQFPTPFATTSQYTGLQSIQAVNPSFPNERTQQWTASIGHQIWGTAIDIGYVGTKVTNIPYTEDRNLLFPSTTPFALSRRPYPEFTSVSLMQTGASSFYNGLTIQADRHMASGLYFNVNYTWAKSMTDVNLNGYAITAQQNQYQRSLERAPDFTVRPQQLQTTYTYELPVGHGKALWSGAPRWANAVVGGWQLSGILSCFAGQLMSPIYSGVDAANTNQAGGRPDRIGNGNIGISRDAIRAHQPILDVNAFVRPVKGRGYYGNSARDVLDGPGEVTWNSVVAKNFGILHERARMQLRWEAFNALNRANFNNPNLNINSGIFGIVSGAGAARSMLFGLRLDY